VRPSDKIRANFIGDDAVSADLRFRAEAIIRAKLTGDRRREALAFLRYRKRRAPQVEALLSRLEALPDLYSTAAHAKLTLAQVAAMREQRAAGAPLAELAEQYGISVASVSRACTGGSYR
jgi:C4-dicarboxylate-specific signal transduction histidine kinase